MQATAEKIYSFADFEIDTAKRLLLKNGKAVPLAPKAFDLLQVLVQNSGEILSKDELFETLWKDQFVEENNLTVHIAALRKILGEKRNEHRFIVTVPGKGYSFVADLDDESNGQIVVENHRIERITIDEEIVEKPREFKKNAGETSPRRKTMFAVGSLALLILVGFFAFRYFTQAPKTQINSLAVLPFVNQNNDANMEYLSDGISESVIYSLSQLPNLRVMSRNSVFRYKGKDADAKVIGGELDVQAILIGRVTQRGDMLTVSAELVDASNNAVLWGEQFTRKMSDAEELQADITRSISEKLRLKLSGADELKISKHPTENAEAYRLYLQGLFYWNKRTPDDIGKSIKLFNQAIELDPLYSQAYGALAMAYNTLPDNAVMTKEEIAENLLKEKAVALKALELDDALPEARAVLADIKIKEWDFAGGENQFKRAIELNPNFASAHQWYSELLANLGRYDEAFAEIRRAHELDPFSRAINMNIGVRYTNARRFDEALAQFKEVAAAEPDYPLNHFFAARAYENKGMFEEAIDWNLKSFLLFEPEKSAELKQKAAALRQALKTGGAKGYWLKKLDYTLEDYKNEIGYVSAVTVAEVYARLGEKDKAFEWLEKDFTERASEGLVFIKAEPAFDSIADDRRFKEILRRVGLPQ